MKRKTIKAVLDKKIADWLSSIKDESLRAHLADKVIVTGGCIASMLLHEHVNDFDIYLTEQSAVERVARYYCAQFNESRGETAEVRVTDDRVELYIPSIGELGELPPERQYNVEMEEALENGVPDDGSAIHEEIIDPYHPLHLSANAITLSGQIQIIIRFYGNPDDIHENFDFVHCTNYYDTRSGAVTLNTEALECLLARELRYMGSKYPLASIIRTRKFLKRGYSINAGQYLKMALQLNEMDLFNIAVLREQLTGVDLTYFQSVLSLIDQNRNIDAAYLSEIIDRIF